MGDMAEYYEEQELYFNHKPMALFTPPNSYTLDSVTFPQIRLGIQGAPGTGKTWSALTFPNPIVLDFDNKLGAHAGRKDVTVIPFFDPKYIWDVLKCSNEPYKYGHFPSNNNSYPANRRDALLRWISKYGPELSNEQTLVLDSWTSVQNSFHEQQDREPQYTKKNEVNEFAPWMEKIRYSAAVCKALEGLKCNVITTFHEFAERDPKTGELLEKNRPLMQGKFVAEVGGHFTDFVRQVVVPQKNSKGVEIEINAPPLSEGKYTPIQHREFFWQIIQDDTVDAHTCMTKCGTWKYIPAHYESFVKYK